MKKISLSAILLLSTILAFSHSDDGQFQYSIVFGNCFGNEKITLMINGNTIFRNHKLATDKKEKTGNLSLTQTTKGITIYHNSQIEKKPVVKYNFILNLEVLIDGRATKHIVDLRKGKVVLIEFCKPGSPNVATKKLSIEQIQEPVLLM